MVKQQGDHRAKALCKETRQETTIEEASSIGVIGLMHCFTRPTMKFSGFFIILSFLFSSCSLHENIVEDTYVNGMLNDFAKSKIAIANQLDIVFWKKRINPANPQYQNELRYAGVLTSRFRYYGDINDVALANNVYREVNKTYNSKLAGPFLGLASSAMLTHKFAEADTLLKKAKLLGIDGYTANLLSFDIAFEQGRYGEASAWLENIKYHNDYNYYFRKSKFEHFKGNTEEAISAMLQATEFAKVNKQLESSTFSNLGDLYVHAGKFKEAAKYYQNSLAINGNDFHSMMGLGWVALVYDDNIPLASKLFSFVYTKYELPEPLYKLYEAAQVKGDTAAQRAAASRFVAIASEERYGRMYNKYLIEIFSGILPQPVRAEALAKDELHNRKTPQTCAWYAYTLLKNGKPAEAYQLFQREVSGKPLEGLELYYMGKMMQQLHKGYDAGSYFKAAYETRYDLSPAIQADLALQLAE